MYLSSIFEHAKVINDDYVIDRDLMFNKQAKHFEQHEINTINACFIGDLATVMHMHMNYSNLFIMDDDGTVFAITCRNGRANVVEWLYNRYRTHIKENAFLFGFLNAFRYDHNNTIKFLEELPEIKSDSIQECLAGFSSLGGNEKLRDYLLGKKNEYCMQLFGIPYVTSKTKKHKFNKSNRKQKFKKLKE